MVFFFFQAEDGIRDVAVTGVQTCALPICGRDAPAAAAGQPRGLVQPCPPARPRGAPHRHRCRPWRPRPGDDRARWVEIGRASCRERVWMLVVGVSLLIERTTCTYMRLTAV